MPTSTNNGITYFGSVVRREMKLLNAQCSLIILMYLNINDNNVVINSFISLIATIQNMLYSCLYLSSTIGHSFIRVYVYFFLLFRILVCHVWDYPDNSHWCLASDCWKVKSYFQGHLFRNLIHHQLAICYQGKWYL